MRLTWLLGSVIAALLFSAACVLSPALADEADGAEAAAQQDEAGEAWEGEARAALGDKAEGISRHEWLAHRARLEKMSEGERQEYIEKLKRKPPPPPGLRGVQPPPGDGGQADEPPRVGKLPPPFKNGPVPPRLSGPGKGPAPPAGRGPGRLVPMPAESGN